MHTPEEKKRALIVVRTYPTPAKSGAEVSCTAAITDKGEWLRLFPVPWRYLPQDQRFRKYLHAVEVMSGVLLLLVGGLVFANRLTWLSGKLGFLNHVVLWLEKALTGKT